MSLVGKVCIVTGGSAGIGRACVLALAAQGATAVAAARTIGAPAHGDRPASGRAEVVAAGAQLPGRVDAKLCDVESESDVVRMVEEVMANHGRIDVLVNNAALYTRHDSLGMDSADYDRYLRVNLRGAWLTLTYVVPRMVRQRSGSVVNMTSPVAVSSSKGSPGRADLMHYSVSKAALDRMSPHLAEDLQEHEIAVNALSPGVVLTKQYLA